MLYLVILALVSISLIALFMYYVRFLCSAKCRKSRAAKYPYRPDVEMRLPDGRLTTLGYAAEHPKEFRHWGNGPDNIYGENIDKYDWQEWKINYAKI